MKRILFYSLSVFVMLAALSSCNRNPEKATAEKFLNGLYHYNYEDAKSVSTEETKRMVDLMAQFSAMMPDSVKQAAKKVKIDVKDVKVDGDKAVATYTTSDDAQEKKLNMIKKDDKWLVEYSKMDSTEDENATPETEEPAEQNGAETAPAEDADTTAH